VQAAIRREHSPLWWSKAAALLSISSMPCCAPDEANSRDDYIDVGVILPFTGIEAATGRNIEQAILLAAEDINGAGGIQGRPIRILSRDSNSGSERGFQSLLGLLYDDEVKYLIGPEENELALESVPDIKGLDVLNILPGYTSPSIQRTSTRGAWLRLAPTSAAVGCAMAKHAVQEGADTANVLVLSGDYNASLASDFGAQFGQLGGRTLPSVTADADASGYVGAISQVFSYKADRTLLIANPTAASTIATEWVIGGRRGFWYLSPMLKADVLLLNIPYGALDGYFGLSPSLSLASECSGVASNAQGYVGCSRANATAFSEHFASRWDQDRPFLTSQFYYDAVVLLAMGLQYGVAVDGELPNTRVLQKYIRGMGTEVGQQVSWQDLDRAMGLVASGSTVRYAGAAAEYHFDEFGAAKHVVFDTWTAHGQSFQDTGTFFADCPKNK